MTRQSTPREELTRRVHEVLFSLTMAFAAISILFIAVPQASMLFVHLEVLVNKFLHIRQTDMIRGYFEFSIPSVLLALLFWLILRLSSRTKITAELLRSFAGILVLSALPLFWLYVAHSSSPSSGFPDALLFELLVILICAVVFLCHTSICPLWFGIIVIAAHYAFWFNVRGNYQLANYAGPAAPVLGFCAGSIWVVYVSRSKRAFLPDR